MSSIFLYSLTFQRIESEFGWTLIVLHKIKISIDAGLSINIRVIDPQKYLYATIIRLWRKEGGINTSEWRLRRVWCIEYDEASTQVRVLLFLAFFFLNFYASSCFFTHDWSLDERKNLWVWVSCEDDGDCYHCVNWRMMMRIQRGNWEWI